jgi:lipase chaperone LimK
MRRALVVALAVGAVVGIALLRPPRPGDGDDPPTPAASRPAGGPEGSATTDVPRAADGTPARPRSLRGTRVDGGLLIDPDGRFVPTLDARRLFDYFLSASGELPPDALRARIVREIERRLAPEPAREAVALLDRYLAYRDRVRGLATAATQDVADLESRLATLEALRREMLGPVAADAFFAEDEAQARRVLAIRRIAADPTLTAEERARRVEELYAAIEAELPPDVRESRAAGRLASALQEAEDEIRAKGGTDADVQALRERLAGPEVAARLAELDARRARWLERVAGFRANRERIANDASLAPDERAAAIEQLLERSFTAAERRRVEALDRLAAESDAR